jgi:hypothetical protein
VTETDFSTEINTSPELHITYDSDTDVSFEYNSGSYQQASALTVGGITQPIRAPLPEKGELFIGRLTRDDAEHDFTHKIETVGRDAKNKVNITSFGFERNLHQTTLTREFEDDFAEDVIKAAADKAQVPRLNAPFPAEDDVDDPESKRALRLHRSEATNITADYQAVPAIKIIEEVCRSQSWTWRVTSSNGGGSYLWYGDQSAATGVPRDAVPDIQRGAEGIEEALRLNTAPKTYELRWIKADDTDPRSNDYRFDTIRVVGPPRRTETNGVVVEQVDPIVAEIDVGPAGSDSDGGGDGPGGSGSRKRVHLFESDAITSQGHANNLARQMWKALERQSQSGPVTVVGDPRIEPLDRVVFPEWTDTPGANRLVESVLHTIDKDEGFLSTIFTAGQPDLSKIPEVRTNPTRAATVVSEDG